MQHRRTTNRYKKSYLKNQIAYGVGVDGFEWRSHRADTLLKSAGQSPSNKPPSYRLNRMQQVSNRQHTWDWVQGAWCVERSSWGCRAWADACIMTNAREAHTMCNIVAPRSDTYKNKKKLSEKSDSLWCGS